MAGLVYSQLVNGNDPCTEIHHPPRHTKWEPTLERQYNHRKVGRWIDWPSGQESLYHRWRRERYGKGARFG